MAKCRSLAQQLKHAVGASRTPGTSKHAYRQTHGGRTDERIYTRQRAESLERTAARFGAYAQAQGVRWARDLAPEQAQAYLEHCIAEYSWSARTAELERCNLAKLGECIEAQYGAHVDLHAELPVHIAAAAGDPLQSIRHGVTMTREHLDLVRDTLERSQARVAVELSARCGLRADEAAHLQAVQIDTEHWQLHLTHCKNGRWRDVPIRSADQPYFANLRQDLDRRGIAYACAGVSTKALEDSLRAAMQRAGIKDLYPRSGYHSLRRLYAQERYAEERAAGLPDRDAWCIVQAELGHGSEFRSELYNNYLGRTT